MDSQSWTWVLIVNESLCCGAVGVFSKVRAVCGFRQMNISEWEVWVCELVCVRALQILRCGRPLPWPSLRRWSQEADGFLVQLCFVSSVLSESFVHLTQVQPWGKCGFDFSQEELCGLRLYWVSKGKKAWYESSETMCPSLVLSSTKAHVQVCFSQIPHTLGQTGCYFHLIPRKLAIL